MLEQQNSCEAKRAAFLRVAIAFAAAGMIVWALLPTVCFSIFNLGTAALLAVFFPVFLAAVFWPYVRRGCLRLRRKKAGKWLLRLVAVLLAMGAGFGATVVGMMISAAHSGAEDSRALPVIVLGCQTNGYAPSPMLLSRLQKAKEYLDRHPEAVAIVSGGMGGNEGVSEAESMRAWLERNGIEPERILKEDQSASTEENIRFSVQLMNRERLGTQALIVTDWWHEWRASYWARQNGILAAAEPCATWAPLLPVFFARELCGVVRLLLAGY